MRKYILLILIVTLVASCATTQKNVDKEKVTEVKKENLLYKCGWSPFEGHTFKSSVAHTFVNGVLAYSDGKVNAAVRGERLSFNR